VSQDQGGLAALKWVNMIPDLYGPWLMVLAFLPLLRASAHPRIVNVSSEAASLAGLGSETPGLHRLEDRPQRAYPMLAAELRRESPHIKEKPLPPGRGRL
jgi:NAD(P)-dependent dehydrogenase (short-subunit alcohol dehydrogenase family)